MALYALGIGACGGDAVDDKELTYVYHGDGQHHVKVQLPVADNSHLVLIMRLGQ